jgi:predicted nucleic acid-binding protein
MNLVVDANIIFAAIIKENFSYKLLFNENLVIYTPEYMFKEIEKHKREILEKTEKSEEEFTKLVIVLKRKINLVSLDKLTDHIDQAEKITPDPDDMVYFALALKLNCAIWSNDKALKEKQDFVKVYPTHELVKLIEV